MKERYEEYLRRAAKVCKDWSSKVVTFEEFCAWHEHTEAMK